MEKRSLRREATTTNMIFEPGAITREASEIADKSRALARKIVGDDSPEDRIMQRCSIAVGDFNMAGLLRFKNDPIGSGIEALGAGAVIYTDIRMVQAGIAHARGHQVLCALDFGLDVAKSKGITRTSAGFLSLGKKLDGSIVVIGNAPSSLLAVCELVQQGVKPALIIGAPVGFVNAAESKEKLRTLDVPSISTEGTRGGTPVAVAAMNELIIMYAEATPGERPGVGV